jgi:hypothetical protein
MSTFSLKHLTAIAYALREDRKKLLKIVENKISPSEECDEAIELVMTIDEALAIVRKDYELKRSGATNAMHFDELFSD